MLDFFFVNNVLRGCIKQIIIKKQINIHYLRELNLNIKLS